MVEVKTNIVARFAEVMAPESKGAARAAREMTDAAMVVAGVKGVASAATAAGHGLVSDNAAIAKVNPEMLGILIPNLPAVAAPQRAIGQGQGAAVPLPPR